MINNYYKQNVNKTNNFKVVLYQPTLKQLTDDHLKMSEDGVAYGKTMNRLIQNKSTQIDELLKNTADFFEVLLEMKKQGAFSTYNYGLLEMSTGRLIRNFYIDVISYHPNASFVVFEKQDERKIKVKEPTFVIVSLESGEELPIEFRKITGISDSVIQGVPSDFNDSIPMTYKIGPENSVFVSAMDESIDIPLSEPTKFEFDVEEFDQELDIKVLIEGLPYFCSKPFLDAVQYNDELFKLFELKEYEIDGITLNVIRADRLFERQLNLNIGINLLSDFYHEKVYNLDLKANSRLYTKNYDISPYCEPLDYEPDLANEMEPVSTYFRELDEDLLLLENDGTYESSELEEDDIDLEIMMFEDYYRGKEYEFKRFRYANICRMRQESAPELYIKYFEPFFNSTLKAIYDNNLLRELEFNKPEFKKWIFLMLTVMTEYYFREVLPHDSEMKGYFEMCLVKGNALSYVVPNFNKFYGAIPW